MEDPAVTNFREYLKIKTVQPDPDYDGANEYLKKQAEGLGLRWKIIQTNAEPRRQVFLMTWEGRDPTLPSVLLNSHIDVVPVFPEFWTHDPFAAVKTENGDIHARGSQDMKCVGIWYLEAIRRMKKNGKRFIRTIHLTFVPDEEIGGYLGMKIFVNMDEFKQLNVGAALDEGLANPTEAFTVYYGERAAWWLEVRCPGDPGHGSRFIENAAAVKLRKVINKFMDFREIEKKRLESDPNLRLGDVTTVNLNIVKGGVQPNVVPAELFATFDVRITPTVNLKEFQEKINSWCKEAGDDVTYTFRQEFFDQTLTPTTKDNPWWNAFSTTCEKLKMKIELEIFPAATDSRYVREKGIPAIGFSPINKTPILLHDHNEFLNEKTFLDGIGIYEEIIAAMASVPKY